MSNLILVFFESMDTLVIPDLFARAIDLDLLRSLPNIIGSPYVTLDPGLYVMYYAALHYGLNQIRGPGHAMTKAAYLKALEHTPAWLEGSTETDMDGYTAALTAWTAINNLDYQLSWKFHLKACYNLKSKGIDVLDVSPASTFEEEEKRDAKRFLFWHGTSAWICMLLHYLNLFSSLVYGLPLPPILGKTYCSKCIDLPHREQVTVLKTPFEFPGASAISTHYIMGSFGKTRAIYSLQKTPHTSPIPPLTQDRRCAGLVAKSDLPQSLARSTCIPIQNRSC